MVYFSDFLFELGKELKNGGLLAQVVIYPRSLFPVLEFIDKDVNWVGLCRDNTTYQRCLIFLCLSLYCRMG